MTPGAMHASRRLDSQLKAQQVRAAVGALVTAGRPATIAQVAREAGVSRKFIYAHPEPRAEIEHRGLAAAARPGVGLAAQARVSAASLRADAENARARDHRLRQQVSALEQRLSEALGRQVADALSGQELLDDPVETLRADFAGAQQRVFELKEALAEAGEELTAVREINHELLARANRAGG